MKRLAELRDYVTAVFSDVRDIYSSESEWERDLSRLLHETASRGLRSLTIDLPSLSKHFDWCLGQELYTPSGEYLGTLSRRAQVPVFLQDLHLQVFDHEGKLRDTPCPNSVFAIRQIYKGLSKLKALCAEKEISNEVRNFAAIEANLKAPSLSWTGSLADFRRSADVRCSFRELLARESACTEELWPDIYNQGFTLVRDRRLVSTMQQVCDHIASGLGDFYDEEADDLPKHGKGRVSDASKDADKYQFPTWSPRLDSVFPFDLYGCLNLDHYTDLRDTGRLPLETEAPSKLIAVPKTMKGPRLIAAEPTSNQWCQQLLWQQLRSRIKQSPLGNCIDFRRQDLNGHMARESSKTDSHSTVDLSSASDRLSLWCLERALRSNQTLLERIYASRSTVIRNGIDQRQWDYILLKKAFSQGNACTFPVQSIVYSMFAMAAVLHSQSLPITKETLKYASSTIQVYGDDIVIPRTAFESLSRIFSLVQLEINTKKTFVKGPFRESCGYDAFLGSDVTPGYVKQLDNNLDHERAASALQASNNLHCKGLWRTANWQLSRVATRITKHLPFVGVGSELLLDCGETGVSTYSGPSKDHLDKRWNSDLQREEYLTSTLHSKVKKVKSSTISSLFQYNIEKPSPTKNWTSGTVRKTSALMRKTWR